METAIYYVLCAMTLGGALGVILARGYVNAAMSMLLLPVLERKERAGNWTIISDEKDSLIGEYIEF